MDAPDPSDATLDQADTVDQSGKDKKKKNMQVSFCSPDVRFHFCKNL